MSTIDGERGERKSRPWYRLHWLTWVLLVLAVVLGGFRVDYYSPSQRSSEMGGYLVSYWAPQGLSRLAIGFPFDVARLYIEIDITGSPRLVHSDFAIHDLAANLPIALVLLASFAFVIELALRRPGQRAQLSLRMLLCITAAIGVLLACYRSREWLPAAAPLVASLLLASVVLGPVAWLLQRWGAARGAGGGVSALVLTLGLVLAIAISYLCQPYYGLVARWLATRVPKIMEAGTTWCVLLLSLASTFYASAWLFARLLRNIKATVRSWSP